eukprot:CAMPEP_0181322752 /NCGR_PEP_ID=MMETSP1101-20121128/19399_1 /TAXON_ID=46948 /ORGANISM="Rhodomonas abbreviata, Strain Caron Lab Isolate" /LENGTH=86 /DNA_ID=CAMNT_0023430693 /DNA_START=122 /DNA_END=379 /DNA_ORIENTATION=-
MGKYIGCSSSCPNKRLALSTAWIVLVRTLSKFAAKTPEPITPIAAFKIPLPPKDVLPAGPLPVNDFIATQSFLTDLRAKSTCLGNK